MKKLLLFAYLICLFSVELNAQSVMSDTQVAQFMQREARSGTSRSQIVIKLMQRGVNMDQIQRVRNQYEKQLQKTDTGVSAQARTVEFDDTNVKVNYIDTAGQEMFKSISLNYLKGADGAILVFDITNKETFDVINNWVDDIKENNPMGIGKILIGNKLDLEDRREITKAQGEQLAKQLECPYFETSAKTGKNIIEALDEIAKITYFQWKQTNGRHSIKLRSSESVKAVKGEKQKEDKKGCCVSS